MLFRRDALYAALLGLALLLVAAAVAYCPAGGMSAAKTASRRVAESVPPAARPHIKQFLAGASAVALVGRGLWPVPETAAQPSSSSRGFINALTMQPVEKLFYALGGIVAELLLLRLLVSQPRSPAFAADVTNSDTDSTATTTTSSSSTNKAKVHVSRLQRLFTTHVGWLLLVFCVAIPNGVVEAGLIVAVATRLPLATYAPALVIGKLAQPYVAAALYQLPCVQQLIQTTSWLVKSNEKSRWASLLPSHEEFVEVALWTAVGAVIILSAARFVCAEPTTIDDGDDMEVVNELMAGGGGEKEE